MLAWDALKLRPLLQAGAEEKLSRTHIYIQYLHAFCCVMMEYLLLSPHPP